MSKSIDVFEKYKEVKDGDHNAYYAVSEARVIKALKFRQRAILGVVLAVVLGAGVFALINFALFLKLALFLGAIGAAVGAMAGIVWTIGESIEAADVLGNAKSYGVIPDE